MDFAREFWKCMFEFEKDEEFVYTLFSTFDEPLCIHNGPDSETTPVPVPVRVRDACSHCLRSFLETVKSLKSMVRLHCYRNYVDYEKSGTRFTIFFYPFTSSRMCTTIDIMPDCMNSFLYKVLKNNSFSAEQVDFTASEFKFNHCAFDEEIDIFERRGDLRLWLFFRFLFLESIRSKNPTEQRHKIYQLMVENEMAQPIDIEEEECLCKNYNHSQIIQFHNERLKIIINDDSD